MPVRYMTIRSKPRPELARLLLGCGLTVENIAVDLLCVGMGACLYRTVRDNLAEPRLGSSLARE